jgi:hypothetical protein
MWTEYGFNKIDVLPATGKNPCCIKNTESCKTKAQAKTQKFENTESWSNSKLTLIKGIIMMEGGKEGIIIDKNKRSQQT